MRPANAIDFWRGFALVTIFVNHIPGLYFERFTHRNVSFSDSADLFVFLAGWGLRYTVGRSDGEVPLRQVMMRLFGRAVTLYAAQMLLVAIAIAVLGASARALANPLILEWINAAAVFYNPVDAHVGLALLTYQLGYFDILPLYIILMLLAPAMTLVHRRRPNLLLPISLTIYLLALVFRLNLPTWPVRGQWFFNPLCWQLVFVLGFTMGRDRGPSQFIRRHIGLIRAIALPLVLAASLMIWFDWLPNPTRMPSPRLLFILSKTYETPLRLIQFLALVALFSGLFPLVARHFSRLTAYLSMLGRNSLHVFCVGSLLSLLAQVVRIAAPPGLGVDTAILIVGLIMLGFTAWLSEWRDRWGARQK